MNTFAEDILGTACHTHLLDRIIDRINAVRADKISKEDIELNPLLYTEFPQGIIKAYANSLVMGEPFNLHFSGFTDWRDRHSYSTIILPNGDEWMIDDLSFIPESVDSDTQTYRDVYKATLVSRQTMKYNVTYGGPLDELKPFGWRFPTRDDIEELAKYFALYDEDKHKTVLVSMMNGIFFTLPDKASVFTMLTEGNERCIIHDAFGNYLNDFNYVFGLRGTTMNPIRCVRSPLKTAQATFSWV
ncbi:MAG: hypothetical protein MJZ25_08905 [Fibrobacter sp.]|nr:hypothetical protein [Fibrobacter sp.]